MKMTLTGGGGSCRYTVEHRDGCILVEGAVPVTAFGVLAKLVPDSRHAVLDARLARLAACNIALGTPADCKALAEKLAPASIARYEALASTMGLPDGSGKWLGAGEWGTSSMAMFRHLSGYEFASSELNPSDLATAPRDADDLRRCLAMLDAVPSLKGQVERMRELSPVWAGIVDQWGALRAFMSADRPEQASRLLSRIHATTKG